VDLRGGRITMLANARRARLRLQPDLALLVPTVPTAGWKCVVVEVHNTYGDRHAYLVRPDGSGRASTSKELYVSPFNDVSGSYDLLGA
jgi:DUF1365 family protein